MIPFARLLKYGNNAIISNSGTRTLITPVPSPTARFSFGYTSLGTDAYLYGGAVVGSDYNNEFWKFDGTTETWTQLQSGLLSMHGSGLAAYNGKVYMFGGYTGSLINRFFVYDIASNTWGENTTSINPPTARHHCRFVSTGDGKLYLWGSLNGSELYSYDIASNTWVKLTSSTIQNSLAGDMTTDGTYLYCSGTSNQRYNISTATWSTMAALEGRMTYNPIDGRVYCVNSERLYRYDGTLNAWVQVGDNSAIGISRGAVYTFSNSTKVISAYGSMGTSANASQYKFT